MLRKDFSERLTILMLKFGKWQEDLSLKFRVLIISEIDW